MPFFPACSIDGCVRIFEPEIRYSLCPKAKKKSLKFDIEQLEKRKKFTADRIKELTSNEERESDNEVAAWMDDVDELSVEVEELLSSLATNRCCHLRSNYKSGRDVDEMRRRIEALGKTRDKWDGDPNKLFKPKPPQVSPPTANGIPEGSPAVQEEPLGSPQVSSITANEITEESSAVQEPWTLFCPYDLITNPSIEQQAREIAETLVECCGSSNSETLDLAVRVVAASLKNHSTVRRWKEAAEKLLSIAASGGSVASDGAPMIERILRLCYDGLESGRLRDCLSVFASIVYSGLISEKDIISYWMGEELLDDGVNMDEARDEGRRVIDKLRAAHWLQSSHWCDYFLIMDVHIRCMVRNASGDTGIPTPSAPQGRELQSWSDSKATRVWVKHSLNSLPDSARAFEEDRLPEGTPECRHLVSLLLHRNESITKIHDDFFRFTPRLLMLDLSYTNIQVLPRSIGELKFLRMLNLTKTRISSLPIELGDMEDLRELEMKDNRELKGIHRECITRLSKLQALLMRDNGHEWSPPGSEYLSLEDLGGMAGIQQLFLTARTKAELTEMRRMFGSALTGLMLEGENFAPACMRSVFSSLPRLECLEVNGYPRLGELLVGDGDLGRVREIVLVDLSITRIAPEAASRVSEGLESFLPTLRQLGLLRCHSLPNLAWIGSLAKLELVCLEDCRGISMLVDKVGPGDRNAGSEEPDDGGVTFPNLQLLVLVKLPQLRSFSWRHHPLRLPSLRTLRVRDCRKLKKLPLGPRSCEDMKEIKGTRDWWNSLQWDHSDIRDKFEAYFQPYD